MDVDGDCSESLFVMASLQQSVSGTNQASLQVVQLFLQGHVLPTVIHCLRLFRIAGANHMPLARCHSPTKHICQYQERTTQHINTTNQDST